MASCSSSFFAGLATFLLLLLSAESAIAPGPKPAPLNLTGVLEKGGQYTTFLRMLKETQVGQQIESQLNSSFNGLTIFAPTDNAFNNLKAGTLNSLAPQDQVNLILYHVLPRYYSLSTFETTSNPVNTQASGNTGVYTVNITSTSNQINVSTGVNEAPVSNSLYVDFPLAVYSVDQVLLPNELFGAKPPAEAPSPAAAPVKPKTKTKSSPAAAVAEAPASDETTASAANLKGGSVGGGLLLLGIGLVGIGSLF